ncbi:hypothetical protein ANN_19327 [Periplaneta americana]|uniref:Uncharacterized protein n=1 Tax=Periplaneta americana TaxID=6978 RepID=A0ABQ8S9K5_PERAM|nr:hypothetical protein ANN_19327 [Periplaneta americana]
MAGLCEGGNEPPGALKASNMVSVPHTLYVRREVVDAKFPNRWIGRSGPVRWPARSRNLTPLDFFFWGAVKDRVCQ